MRINTNLAALNAWRALTINNTAMTKSLEKLSSGYRVNRAADDAAGLAVSEKMRAQIRGLNMAIRNAQDGVSLIQTAEGGAQKIQDILQRMRELAVQASNGTLKPEDRALLDTEFQQLIKEIDRTADSTTFNQLKLITPQDDGSGSTTVPAITIQVGANYAPDASGEDHVNAITLNMDDLTAKALLVDIDSSDTINNISDLAIVEKDTNGVPDPTDDGSAAQNAIALIDKALEKVSETRARFGAYQNRLEATIQTLQVQAENLTAAESRIRDVDMALEMANFTKYQILQQASTAMLAQANMSTQSILSLLR